MKKVSFIFTVILFLLLVYIGGCSSTRGTIVDRSFSSYQIMEAVNSLSDSIHTFSAYGSINVVTPQLSQGAGLDLLVKKSESPMGPDSIRIIVEGPFGITLVKALFTRTHFTAYNALNNTLYEGDPNKGMRMLPIMSSFPPDLLIDALSGVRRFDDHSVEPDSFYTTESFYVLVFSNDIGRSIFSIDLQSLRIVKVKTYKNGGELLWEESYDYRKMDNGSYQQETARIHVPERSITVEINFDEITLNSSIDSMTISTPDDAERVTLR